MNQRRKKKYLGFETEGDLIEYAKTLPSGKQELVEIVIFLAGGQAQIAEILEISPQAVQQWPENGIPGKRALGVFRLINEKLPLEKLLVDSLGAVA